MFLKSALIRILILAGLSVGMMAPSAFANEPRLDQATQLVEELIERIQTVLKKDPTPEEVRVETNLVIDEFFDYNIIARFAAGQAWRSAKDTEKEAYKNAFREVLLSLAETQFELFKTLEYTSLDAVAKGKKLVVASGTIHDVTGKLPDSIVSWRISTREGKPMRIIDIEVENISMLITQQQENTAIIRQNGGKFSALIEALEQQAISIKANQ